MRPRAIARSVGDLLERAAEVDGAGATACGVRPRQIALDGEVELERAGAVPVPAVGTGDAGRHLVAQHRDRPGRQVEQHDVGGRDVAGCADNHPGADLAAVLSEQRAEGVGDRLGAPSATGQPWRCRRR